MTSSSTSTITLTVDDTAPAVQYNPSPDQLPVPQNQQLELSGWVSQFNNQYLLSVPEFGNGTSNHLTALQGASFQFSFAGTGVTLLGVAHQAAYDIRLDESLLPNLSPIDSQTLYQNLSLAPGNHTISLTVSKALGSPDSFVSFDKALLQTTVSTNTSTNAQVLSSLIPDNSLAFMGAWSAMQISPELVAGSDDFTITTFHQTQAAGDSISLSLPFPSFDSTSRPVSLSIIGLRSSLNGLYSVAISDHRGHSLKQTYNASFGWSTAADLFVQPDLNLALGSEGLGSFTITITNEEQKPLAIAAINVTSVVTPGGAGPSSLTSASSPSMTGHHSHNGTHLSTGTIVALILSSISIAIFAALGLLFFLYRRHWRRKQRRAFIPSSATRSADIPVPDAPPKSKSKSNKEETASAGSVLDIGRPAPVRTSSSSRSRGDRFTHSVRQLSLPRTVRSTSGGGIREFIGSTTLDPMTDDFPAISIPRRAPFVFSFDTSGSNSPRDSYANANTQSPRSSAALGAQPSPVSVGKGRSNTNSTSSDSGRQRRGGAPGDLLPLTSRFSTSTQPQLTPQNTATTPSSNATNFHQANTDNGNDRLRLPLVSRFSDTTRQTQQTQPQPPDRTSGASGTSLPQLSIPSLPSPIIRLDDGDSPTLPSDHSNPSRSHHTTSPPLPPSGSPERKEPEAGPSHQRSQSDPEALNRLLPQLRIPDGQGRIQQDTPAQSSGYEWGYAYRPDSWGSNSMIRSRSHSVERRRSIGTLASDRSQPAMLFTLPPPTAGSRAGLHPFAHMDLLTSEAGASRRASAQTQHSDVGAGTLDTRTRYQSGTTTLPSAISMSDSESPTTPSLHRPSERRRGVRRSFSLVFRNRSSLEAANTMGRLRPPGFELADVIIGPRPQPHPHGPRPQPSRGTHHDRSRSGL